MTAPARVGVVMGSDSDLPCMPWLFVAGLGHDSDDIDIARLALINAHARRGIAFHMLDSVKAFAHRKANIIQRDIILNIDKRLVARFHAINMP